MKARNQALGRAREAYNALSEEEKENAILSLLRDRPMTTTEVLKALYPEVYGSKASPVGISATINRLRGEGLISRGPSHRYTLVDPVEESVEDGEDTYIGLLDVTDVKTGNRGFELRETVSTLPACYKVQYQGRWKAVKGRHDGVKGCSRFFVLHKGEERYLDKDVINLLKL